MISIIVPVFKAEQYLHRCIESILNQTLSDFELILVNDGSPDNSGLICDELASKDLRIRVLHQQNQGANKARYNGVKLSKGKWITFVDADDYIPNDALQNLYGLASDDTDIVIGWMSTFSTNDKMIDIEEYRRRCIGCHGIDVGPCAHLYRKYLFSDGIFDFPHSLVVGEDNLMNIRLAFKSEKPVKVVHKIVYYYDMLNPESAIHKHKKSLDYENMFHKYRLASIPIDEQKKYIKDLIGIRVYQLLYFIKTNSWNMEWKEHRFSQMLLNDIHSNHYSLNKANRLLLNNHHKFVQWLLVKYAESVKLYYELSHK